MTLIVTPAEAARQAAEETLLDRTIFPVSREAYVQFLANPMNRRSGMNGCAARCWPFRRGNSDPVVAGWRLTARKQGRGLGER